MNSSSMPNWLFELDFCTKTEPVKKVKLHVGLPYKVSQHNWVIDSLLDGLPNQKTHQSKGSDPFQVMILLMLRIRHYLEVDEDEYFCDDVPLRTLLPRLAPISYGLEFQDEIEAMIQKRVDEEEQRLTDKFSKKYPEHYKDVLDKNDKDKEGSS